MGDEKNFGMLPEGPLGVIALDGCQALGAKVDNYLVEWRKTRGANNPIAMTYEGYDRDSYLVETKVPRFGSGEGKGVIETSVRGDDLYILVDVLCLKLMFCMLLLILFSYLLYHEAYKLYLNQLSFYYQDHVNY